MGSSKASRAVQQAASSVLSQLITGLKHSLLLYNDPQLAHSQYGDALAAVAAAAAAGKFPPADLLSSLHPEAAVAAAAAGVAGTGAAGVSGALAGFREAAQTLAAAQAPLLDPSCPNSYPQLPLPDVGTPDNLWRLTAAAAAGGGGGWAEQGQVVDVTAAVVSICLQVCVSQGVCGQEKRVCGPDERGREAGALVMVGACRSKWCKHAAEWSFDFWFLSLLTCWVDC